jgi:DNA topoisomerase-1
MEEAGEGDFEAPGELGKEELTKPTRSTPGSPSPSPSQRTGRGARTDDPKVAAKRAGLRYWSPDAPGIRRLRNGDAFRYVTARGRKASADDVARINSLVIPPAWEKVNICPFADGHIQAVGYDARGRKQYRYHPDWRAARDDNKYERIMDFVRALPKLRRTVHRHLRLRGMPRQKVLAAVVRLLETTLIRVGNDQYAKENNSFGLTTLRNRHVKVNGAAARFRFRGKSGVEHAVDLEDHRLARIIRRCQELPGEELFGYEDDEGNVRDVGSADVNAYLQEITGQPFTAKDFRTWAGTVLAATALKAFEAVDTQAARKRNIVAAIESVARRLGNTKAVCRKCYVHPAILDSYMDGTLSDALAAKAGKELAGKLKNLPAEEAAVLALLQKRLETGRPGPRSRTPRRRAA